jgi:hypothetical protein
MIPADPVLSSQVSNLVERTLNSPPSGAVAIVPSDTAILANPIRGFIVTSAGAVNVGFQDGSTAVLPSGVGVGSIFPGLITQIFATGTTARGIIGFI